MQHTDTILQNTPIIDVDMTNFVAEVIEKSMEVPVVVDFWAPWCEPCKILMPILEKIVREKSGAVIMVKANIDDNQQIAEQMQIRSVPTVVLFYKGRPVDAFAGVKSESEIREFLLKSIPDLMPSDVEQIIELADTAFNAKQFEEAAQLYSEVLQQEGENVNGLAGLSKSLLKVGNIEGAKQLLSSLSNSNKNHPLITSAQSALDIVLQADSIVDIHLLEEAVHKNGGDYQSRYDLALALWVTDQREQAADHLLIIIGANKDWQDGKARKLLLKYFDIAGPSDPFTLSARRKLSSLLFA
jgi:putative thioredoxin